MYRFATYVAKRYSQNATGELRTAVRCDSQLAMSFALVRQKLPLVVDGIVLVLSRNQRHFRLLRMCCLCFVCSPAPFPKLLFSVPAPRSNVADDRSLKAKPVPTRQRAYTAEGNCTPTFGPCQNDSGGRDVRRRQASVSSADAGSVANQRLEPVVKAHSLDCSRLPASV